MAVERNPFFKNLSWGRLRRMFGHFANDLEKVRGELFVALIATFGTMMATLARPWPLKFLYDYALIPGRRLRDVLPFKVVEDWGPHEVVIASCVSLLVIAIVWGLFSYQQGFLIAAAGQRVTYSIRRRYFAHVQRMSLRVHHSFRSGDLVLRVTGDINMLRDMLVDSALIVLSEFLVLFAMVGFMFWLDWRLTVVSMIVLPLMTLTAFRVAHGLREAVRKQRKRDGRMASVIGEVLHAIVLVQAFGREQAEDDRFGEFNKRSLKLGLRTVRMEATLERTIELLVAVGTAVVVWFGVQRVLTGYISPGDLLVFTGYLTGMYRPLRRIARLTARLSKATVAGERIADVLSIKERVKEKRGARPAPPLQGGISFQGVAFGYTDDRLVLENVSFDVAPRESIGIVGANGAGKSTLLALIPRLYDPTEGKVKVDGENVTHFTLESLRDQIGIVLQQPLLFGTSVRENIAYGAPDATMEEIVEAARAAEAHTFIEALPNGYETELAEKGASLSGGQRQKIAIARAILKRPAILLLDEPTTGLDASSAAEVNATLAHLGRSATTFRVAHRVDDLLDADRIVVVAEGTVKAIGTHEELLSSNEWYRAMAASQGMDGPIAMRASGGGG